MTEAVDPLASRLDDPRGGAVVRAAAAWALGRIGTARRAEPPSSDTWTIPSRWFAKPSEGAAQDPVDILQTTRAGRRDHRSRRPALDCRLASANRVPRGPDRDEPASRGDELGWRARGRTSGRVDHRRDLAARSTGRSRPGRHGERIRAGDERHHDAVGPGGIGRRRGRGTVGWCWTKVTVAPG